MQIRQVQLTSNLVLADEAMEQAVDLESVHTAQATDVDDNRNVCTCTRITQACLGNQGNLAPKIRLEYELVLQPDQTPELLIPCDIHILIVAGVEASIVRLGMKLQGREGQLDVEISSAMIDCGVDNAFDGQW
jgi:hypothetical protein